MNKKYIKIRDNRYNLNMEFIGTLSDAKKFLMDYALDVRDKDFSYATDIRKFNLHELIWYVFTDDVTDVRQAIERKEIEIKWVWNDYVSFRETKYVDVDVPVQEFNNFLYGFDYREGIKIG